MLADDLDPSIVLLASVSVVGSTSGSGSGSGAAAVLIPSSTQPGDLLVVCVAFSQTQNGDNGNPSETTPSGWTKLIGQGKANSSMDLYAKTAVSGDAGSTVNFTATATVNTGGDAVVANTWVALDVANSAGAGTPVSDKGYASSNAFSAFTLSGAEQLTLIFYGVNASSTVTWPSGFTQDQWVNNSTWSMGAAWYQGAAGAVTVSTSASNNYIGTEVGV